MSRSRNPHPPVRADVATRVQVLRCEHGHVFVHLCDADDETFAVAPFSAEAAIAVGRELVRVGENALRAAAGEAAPAGTCVH